MSEIGRWLESLGLGHFVSTFADAAIDLDVLAEITEGDLEKLGIPLGHRKRLMRAIAALGEAPSPVEPEASAAGRETTSAAASAHRPDAERRQLTVMFVDLVGSTALSARLDPEDMRDVIRAYQNACAGVITRFEGHVAKYMGDGVLAYFGWPRAHEDEAERAVRAGIDLVQTTATLEPKPGLDLAARVGIATGLVVVGDLIGEGSSEEQAVVGETPNLAARLQALAEPGSVVIAEATGRLVGAAFELRNLGPQTVKGLAEPVAAFAVAGERATASRFEARSGWALSPMVGRDQELALLLERWGQAKAGEGQGVLLVGEAGIGKSRISRALLDAVTDEPHVRIRYQCSPYHTDSALWPVIQQLSRAAGLNVDDPVEASLDKLEALLDRAGGRDAAPLIADLVGLDGTGRYGELDLAPQMQRARTFETLVTQLLGLAARQPILAILEDAHWIDPSTLELIEQCLDRIADARVLLLVTSRPDQQPKLAAHAHVTRLTLNRLGRAGVEAIVARLATEALPAEIIDAIIARTDGVPLFVEELTKAVLETGQTTIPASLHDSLMARLDRIPEVKEIAQMAACIGREFDFSLLAAVADRPTAAVHAALEKLTAAELIFRRGTPPAAIYTFKHALVRDAAYESLLKSDRRRVHDAIARELLAAEERPDARPETIATHLEQSGDINQAIVWWRRAANKSWLLGGDHEAYVQLKHAIELIAELSPTSETKEMEIECIADIIFPAMVVHGPGDADHFGGFFRRANLLSAEVGHSKKISQVIYGHYLSLFNGARLSEALHIAKVLEESALSTANESAGVLANRALGTALLAMGRLGEADAPLLLASSANAKNLGASPFAAHASSFSQQYRSWLLAITGAIDQSRTVAKAAESQLLDQMSVGSISALHGNLCITYYLLRDPEGVRRQAKKKLSAEGDSLPYSHQEKVLDVWAQVLSGDVSAGAAVSFEWLEGLNIKPGRTIAAPVLFVATAEIKAARHEFPEAMVALIEAQRAIDETGERWIEAEVWRLRGVCALAMGHAAEDIEPSDQLRRALEIARAQKARLFELRAACDLARLWAERGDRQKGLDLLAPAYGWFTEGFDTADLKGAKALLDELA